MNYLVVYCYAVDILKHLNVSKFLRSCLKIKLSLQSDGSLIPKRIRILPYSSDLSYKEWELSKPHIPNPRMNL